ncbi:MULTISPECIES: mandelate racemase/muconate lactonizing enzyme family protein [unclassified Shewanella]|uniref:mandelate racemase/muconate lactonizing enzyme family protein n=1 Tax=unclassified Shewanella TaxID=196818 RepID=UPI000C8600BE|nr:MULTISPECIES: mandelate racemase/muconate lactonizing enzyme family protein [unclassified Shewanella]MDO6680099.1 mandelate racemase/muconate lactonizing enzyme family protein [Shewanella sp. 4_MG-2023]PMG40103.1 galactonate dehydratase [Shewanella sp. 10N.286.52.B9]
MKIESVEAILGRVGSRNQLLVKVVTECGIIGWGESGLSNREYAVMGAIKHFSQFLKGKDAKQIGRIWQELYRSHYFEGGRVITAAISAIDIALYDILGKKLNVPVYQLLGGRQRDNIPCFACCYTEADPDKLDDLVKESKALIALGWTTIRVIPSRFDDLTTFEPQESITRTARCLNELRKILGPDITLGIDYHHRLSVAETASFCQRLAPDTLDFIEEPIRNESPEAYKTLRTMTNIPFAIGEEFSSKWAAKPYIEQGLTQYLRIDVCNIGGLTEAVKVSGWAEAHYIDVMPHNPLGPVCTAATNHFAVALPNFSLMETHQGPFSPFGAHDDKLFPQQHKLEGNKFIVPDVPGLGVEVNEAEFRKSTPIEVEAPHLSKRDGSHTNW